MHDISDGRFPLMALVSWVGLCVLVGSLSGLMTRTEISGGMRSLRKPRSDPAELDLRAGVDALYILMGVAAWMIWCNRYRSYEPMRWRGLLIQLGLNFLWSMIFFRWHAIAGALGESAYCGWRILATMVTFWELRPLAGWLMVPYLAWVSFATALNLGIFRLNRNGSAKFSHPTLRKKHAKSGASQHSRRSG